MGEKERKAFEGESSEGGKRTGKCLKEENKRAERGVNEKRCGNHRGEKMI